MAKKTTKKQPAKKSVGRPKFEITEEVMSEVKTLAGQGLTVEQIASCLGISPATFYNRQAENLEFMETIKKGKAIALSKVTNALFENATVERDNTAIIFFLKNRAGWKDVKDMNVKDEKIITLDLTRIGINELSALEAAFEQPHIGASPSRKVPQIIEGVYESSLADD